MEDFSCDLRFKIEMMQQIGLCYLFYFGVLFKFGFDFIVEFLA